MTTRRDFLRQGTLAAAAMLGGGSVPGSAARAAEPAAAGQGAEGADPAIRDLMLHALDAAHGAGYADARIEHHRQSFVVTRERRVVQQVDSHSSGCGVRVLVGGVWGFAATRELTRPAVAAAAREAVAAARTRRMPDRMPEGPLVELAPTPPCRDGRWRSAFEIDPCAVPLDEKLDLLLRTNEAAIGVAGVRHVDSSLLAVREERHFASSEGSIIAQTFVRCWMPMTITAVSADGSDFATRSGMIQPAARGYEHILSHDPVANAPRWADEAVQKLGAKPVEAGRYDLVLHPSHVWRPLRETIGRQTALYGAAYTSGVGGDCAPFSEALGTKRYGPESVNVQGDRSLPDACGTVGWDDEGARPDEFLIVKDGVLHDYPTAREQASALGWWSERRGRLVRSHGCARAGSWARVPFLRMPNVSLLPGERDLSWDDLIAATDRGIAVVGDGAFSIDRPRNEFQFAGQLCYEIRGGKIVGMLRDVAYRTLRTPDLWHHVDMLGGPSSYELTSACFDGAGLPGQIDATSHGCPPARFRDVRVVNTGLAA